MLKLNIQLKFSTLSFVICALALVIQTKNDFVTNLAFVVAGSFSKSLPPTQVFLLSPSSGNLDHSITREKTEKIQKSVKTFLAIQRGIFKCEVNC